tara:strand:+ start:200 stop:571 length:372 start_codon:yes stop_codon:yes gene_type:complete
MNQGVEIILARMDSHPEEFIGELRGNWRWVTDALDKQNTDGMQFLTGEEKTALREKYIELVRGQFTKNVMQQLLRDKDGGVCSSSVKVSGANSTTEEEKITPESFWNVELFSVPKVLGAGRSK